MTRAIKLIPHRIRRSTSLASMPFRLPFLPTHPSPEYLTEFALSQYAIRAVQIPSELLAFARLLKQLKPKNILEIGTNVGGTLLTLCRMADSSATVISVDLPGADFGGGYRSFYIPIFKMFPVEKQRLHLLRADSHSHETKNKVKAILQSDSLDVLFIDGDHTYDGVRADFEMYSPLVRKKGIIALHDIVRCPPEKRIDVPRFWEEIKHQYTYSEIIENSLQGWAGIGIIEKE